MKNITKLYVLIIALFILTGCNPVEIFEEMTEKQDEFSNLSQARLGVKAVVGWNIQNGSLNSVNVVYPEGSLGDMKVSELEEITKEMVFSVFKEKPNIISFGFNITTFEKRDVVRDKNKSIIKGH